VREKKIVAIGKRCSSTYLGGAFLGNGHFHSSPGVILIENANVQERCSRKTEDESETKRGPVSP